MKFASDWEFKLANEINVNAWMTANVDIDANVFVATNSLVENLAINLPASGAFDLILSGAGMIGAHLKHQELIGRLDQIDKKLDIIINRLDVISEQIDSLDQKLIASLRLLENATEVTLATPAASETLELIAYLEKVKQDWNIWKSGNQRQDAMRTRDEIRLRLNAITKTNYFYHHQIVAIGIIVIRDLCHLIDDDWNLSGVLQTYLSYFKRALKPATEGNSLKPAPTDSFPQQSFDYMRSIDLLLGSPIKEIDCSKIFEHHFRVPHRSKEGWFESRTVTKIGSRSKPQYYRDETPSNSLSKLHKGKMPIDAFQWKCNIPKNLYIHVTKTNGRNGYHKNKALFPVVQGLAMTFKNLFKPDVRERFTPCRWEIKFKYNSYSILKLSESGIINIGHGIIPVEFEGARVIAAGRKSKTGIGMLASDALVPITEFSKHMQLSSSDNKKIENMRRYVSYDGRKINGLSSALKVN